MRMLRYFIKSLGLLIFGLIPTYPLMAHTQVRAIWPTSCYIGVDLAKICHGWYCKSGLIYEINGSIDFTHVLLDVDYGRGKITRDHRKEGGSFAASQGDYYRVGLGYNFLTPTYNHNQFFVGLRYARSIFNFRLRSSKLQCNHGADQTCQKNCAELPICWQDVIDRNLAIHWWEVVIGGKVNLVSFLSIGCTARYKFAPKIERKQLFALPFDIPGFGLSEYDHAFGYSGYILVRIPLQKEAPPNVVGNKQK